MASPLEQSGSSLLFATVLGLALVACGSQVDPGESDGADEDGAGGTGAAGGGGGADELPKPDVFACGLPVDCTVDFGHLGESITPEALKCQSDLVRSGEPGVLLDRDSPGPYPIQFEGLTVFRGDGTAVRQYRRSCASNGGCGEGSTIAWQRSDLERCDVVVTEHGDPSPCGEDEEHCAYALLMNCVVLGLELTCEDLTP